MLMCRMIKQDVCRMFTGVMEVLDIFQLTVWEVFMRPSFLLLQIEKMSILQDKLENGNTSGLLQWLRQRIHASGRTWNSEEICKNGHRRKPECSVFFGLFA